MSIKDVGSLPHEPRVVAVVTGSEARPAGPAPVIWAGGATQPTNMTAVDFWLKANTAGTMPTGGTTGQVLKKDSATDYDTSWQADATGAVTLPINQSITDPATEQTLLVTITDNATGEGADRMVFTYVDDTTGARPTFFLNGYAEDRGMPGQDNTVASRRYAALNATRYAARSAVVPIFEIVNYRDPVEERVTEFGVFKGGNVEMLGNLEVGGTLTVGGLPVGGGATIDDVTPSLSTTYSSTKIETLAGGNFDGGDASSVYTGVTFNGGTASG